MRLALVTILPMLAAAILVMVGGERIAQREVETRTEVDRERLLDFSSAFAKELNRLDDLYLNHLDSLAHQAAENPPQSVVASATDLAGVRMIRVFGKSGGSTTVRSDPFRKLPEVELEGRKRPLNLKTGIVIDATLLDQALPVASSWIPAPDGIHQIHTIRLSEYELAALLIEVSEVRKRTFDHLKNWSTTPILPLLEAEERVRIELVGDRVLTKFGPERHGPASAVIPIRTSTGDWQIMAWDGIATATSRDPATLAVATTASLLLLGAGFILYFQQRRSLRLAADRVSFVNRVSHELGTPLTNLSLNLDLAEEALTTRPPEARRRLHLIGGEIERLSRLVANVLTFSRHERDALELKPVRCDPAEVIHRTLDSFSPALERRGIRVESAIAPTEEALIDPDALSQIVGNLISNVEKYASSGRSLTIGSCQENERLSVEVRDLGPGIPESHWERIFTPFERVHRGTNEGSSGTGLGLSIARDLATLMGGDLELIPEPKGTCFRLRIPTPPAMVIVSEGSPAA